MRTILALELADCGAACLAMVLELHGARVPLREVRDAAGAGRDGVVASDLIEVAAGFGLLGRGVRLDVADLAELPRGALLHWDLDHFVVLDAVRRDGSAVVLDPMVGRRRVADVDLGRSFTGVALIFEPTDTFVRGGTSSSGAWRYLRPVLGERGLIAKLLAASLVLRALSLLAPLLAGLVVDRVVPGHDDRLLVVAAVVAISFAGYALLSGAVRARLLVRLAATADVTLATGFLRHLVALPYDFFTRRSAGDLVARMRATVVVRELLTSAAVTSLIDGVTAVAALVVLVVVSWPLGLLALLLFGAQTAVVLGVRRRSQRLIGESLEAQGAEQAYVFQVVSGVEALKAAGAEDRAIERWSGLYARALDASVRHDRLTGAADAVVTGLNLLLNVLLLLAGAALVVHGRLPLGAMVAAVLLGGVFLEPVASLVGTVLRLQLVRSYMDRIGDVLDEPVEQAGRAVVPAPRLTGAISTHGVRFRYTPTGPWVVDDVDVRIEPGQQVAIVGRSGSGKSTLARLLLGLYDPEAGVVAVDGCDVTTLEARSLRSQVGVVTQDAYVFSGTIRDNIALRDPFASREEVAAAAEIACLAADLAAMPLGLDTPLVEGGSTLSGGQRQRLVLARAVLTRPPILLLDEATSALDAVTEAAVVANLAAMRSTRIVIAHRLSTVVAADLILVMAGGRVVEQGTHATLLTRRGAYAALVAGQREDARPTAGR